jgi:hypothetical protein
MSILVRYTGAPGLTADTYDESMPPVEESGEFPPDGLEYHVAVSSGGSFRVSEIGDSNEQFDRVRSTPDADPHRERRRARQSTRGNRDPQHHQALNARAFSQSFRQTLVV